MENSRVNQFAVKPALVSPTIDTALNCDHDSSMRTSRLVREARTPNQGFDRVRRDGLTRGTRGLFSMRTISGYAVLVRSIQ
jgi:hypothetical protein